MRVNWRRVLWIAAFFYVFYCTGCFDRYRSLTAPVDCNPLLLSTCEPD